MLGSDRVQLGVYDKSMIYGQIWNRELSRLNRCVSVGPNRRKAFVRLAFQVLSIKW